MKKEKLHDFREQANFVRVAIELTEVLPTFSEYMWHVI